MGADDYAFRCAILIRPGRGVVVLRSGSKGFGWWLAEWPIDGGLALARLRVADMGRDHPSIDKAEIIQSTERECLAHDRRAKSSVDLHATNEDTEPERIDRLVRVRNFLTKLPRFAAPKELSDHKGTLTVVWPSESAARMFKVAACRAWELEDEWAVEHLVAGVDA